MVRKTFKRTESGKAKFPVLQRARQRVLPKASQGRDVATIAAELETDVETVERFLKKER